MNNDKLPKIAVAQINPKVGDFEYNKNLIVKYLENARINSNNIDLLIFPELCVCGYDPRDLVLRNDFCDKSYSVVKELVSLSINYDFGFVVGSVKLESEKRYNSAFFIYNGKVLFEHKKIELPNYGVFDEKRLYNSGSDAFSSVSFRGLNFSILICEDLWNEENYSSICKNFYNQNSRNLDLIVTINASPFWIGKHEERTQVIQKQIKKHNVPVLYVNIVGAQDGVVYDGGSMYFDFDSRLRFQADFFIEGFYVLGNDVFIECLDLGCDIKVDYPVAESKIEIEIDPKLGSKTEIDAKFGLETEIDSKLGSKTEIDPKFGSGVEFKFPYGVEPKSDAKVYPKTESTNSSHFSIPNSGPVASETNYCNAPSSNKELYGDDYAYYNYYGDIYNALTLGLGDYVRKNNFSSVSVGYSSGIDSTLVSLIAIDSIGIENVNLICMPSVYTSKETRDDSREFFELVGYNNLQEISINNIYDSFLKEFGSDLSDLDEENVALQNLQARIRGDILMYFANKNNSLLLTTGNKSEIAVGYCTLYGDTNGGFNPIKDLYKTQVYEIAKWRNENFPQNSILNSAFQKINIIPENILNKKPSAELKFNQKDSDSLPEYEILDKILVLYIENRKSINEIVEMGFDAAVVEKVANLVRISQFKRSQSAIGTKISKMSFDLDFRYPITNGFI